MAKTTSQTPQVAPAQTTPASAGPAPAASAPARDASNASAQESLAAKQARTFRPLVPGTVLESHTDVDKLAAHVGALWSQITAASAGRASMAPETPVASFEGSDLATSLRGKALSGELAQQGGWVSQWSSVGGLGVSGEAGMFATPLATGQVEIHVLTGDAEPLQQGQASVTTNTGYQAGSTATSGGEAGMGMHGVSAKVSGSESQTAGISGASSRSTQVPVTTFRGVLAFDCTVRVKRAFGPAETRTGRLVAGEAIFSSAFGFGS